MLKTIFLGADHAGFALKETLKKHLTQLGWMVVDQSPVFIESDDYPPIAKLVAQDVCKMKTVGILVCGSGLGMDIAANRVKGARAVVLRTEADAKSSREHNHANIAIFGERITSAAKAKKILDTWLATPYSKEKRHIRRVKEIDT